MQNHKFTTHCVLLFSFVYLSVLGLASNPPTGHRAGISRGETVSQIPLSFIENQGQLDAGIHYYLTGSKGCYYFTPAGIVADLKSVSGDGGVVLRKSFTGANLNPVITGGESLGGRVNIIKGSDKSQWKSNIPAYRSIRYQDLYPGIDLVCKGTNQQLEYDFVVAPHADNESPISKIQMQMEGVTAVKITKNGDLEISTGKGSVYEHSPIAYQDINGQRVPVKASFNVNQDSKVSFNIGNYNHHYPLVIDPLIYSTYLGGDQFDVTRINDIAVDHEGNTYVTGMSLDPSYPTTVGAYNSNITILNNFNIVITKLNPDGSDLVYSTFIVCSGFCNANAIAVDSIGNAYMTGGFSASNFPHTAEGYNSGNPGGIFVVKLNQSGSALIYSATIGSNVNDVGTEIAIDAAGNAFVLGNTQSSAFPVTPTAFQKNYAGNGDGVVFKLNTYGSQLLYSTYLGGNNYDELRGIRVDNSGNAFVTGKTLSSDYPVTTNGYCTTFKGSSDIVLTELNTNGTGLVYSTFIGGKNDSYANALALDSLNNVYLTGATNSIDFPVTAGAFDTTVIGGRNNVYVVKIHPATNDIVYATVIGGGTGTDIQLDNTGNTVVVGETSYDYPVTPNAFSVIPAGGVDIFVTKLNPTGSGLIYSTFMGGRSNDNSPKLALDTQGYARVAGWTYSNDFPVTSNAYRKTVSSGYVFKLEMTPEILPAMPRKLSASKYTDTKIKLIWKDMSNNEWGFGVQRSLSNQSGWTTVGWIPANTTTYIDSGLTPAVNYYYRVFSYNDKGNSVNSNVVSIIPGIPPGGVSNIIAYSKYQAVYISWSNPTDNDLSAVRIVRRTDRYPKSVSDGVTVYWKNGTYCLDTGLKNGQRYYYSAFAEDTAGLYSSYAGVNACPRDILDVSGLNVIPTYRGVKLSWANPASEYVGTLIAYRTDRYPTGPFDGTMLYWYNGTDYTHGSLRSGSKYFYGIYTHDEYYHFSPGIYATAIPNGFTNVSKMTLTSNSSTNSVNLNWNNPGAYAYNGTLIVRRTDRLPIDPADGEVVYWYNGKSMTDSGLMASTTYYYGIFAHETNYDFSPGMAVSYRLNDTRVPAVKQVSAIQHYNDLKFQWQNPADSNYTGTIVVRRKDRFPQSPADGLITFWYNSETFTDGNLTPNEKYYYTFYTHDSALNFGPGFSVAGIPSSFGNIQDITSYPYSSSISMNWDNPYWGGYAGTLIVRRFDRFPVNPFDGELVYWYNGTGFSDVGLAGDTKVYYSIYAHDTNYNFAPGIAVKANLTASGTNSSSLVSSGVDRTVRDKWTQLKNQVRQSATGWQDVLGQFTYANSTVFWGINGLNAGMDWKDSVDGRQGVLKLHGKDMKLTLANQVTLGTCTVTMRYNPEFTDTVITPILLNYDSETSETVTSVTVPSSLSITTDNGWQKLVVTLPGSATSSRLQFVIKAKALQQVDIDQVEIRQDIR